MGCVFLFLLRYIAMDRKIVDIVRYRSPDSLMSTPCRVLTSG